VDAPPTRKLAIIAVGTVVVVGGAIVLLDQPGGPVRVLRGTVVGADVRPSDTEPSQQIVTVALPEGSTAQAKVVARGLVKPGQAVRVNEYSGAITKRKTYEVVSIEGAT
jgi:hypothetical protein